MKRFITLLLLFISIGMSMAFGQRTINGTVTSAEDNQALPGVNVVVKGTTSGVITDLNGVYSIEILDNAASLVFSFVGMQTMEVAINGQTEISVSLEMEVTGLDEVVVVGYGTSIRSELTGSISSVSGDELQKVPNNTFEAALQGKTSGVLMTSTSGKLGEAFNIRVRGTNSITTSNQPLYVIDGMIIASEDFGIETNQPMNPLTTLAPNDIASIDILKDASASAIYGSRGSNGVVIITTKTGKKGQGSNVNFGYSFSSRQPTNRIEMLNADEYVELFSEAFENGEWAEPGEGENFLRDVVFYPQDTADVDWQDHAFKDHAISHEAYLNVTGGSEKTSYYAGISYLDQEGLLIKNNFKRANGRLNLDHKVSKFFDFSVKLNYAQTLLDRVANDNAFATPIQLIAQSPLTPAYLEDGEPNPNTIYFNGLLAERYNKSNVNTSRTISSFMANLHIVPDLLTFTSMVGIDNLNQREEERQSPKTDDGQPAGNGTYRSLQYTVMMTDNYFSFDKTLSDVHVINAVLGMSYQEDRFNKGGIQAKTFPNDAFEDLDGASENSFFSSENRKTTYLSYFLRANIRLCCFFPMQI